MPLPRRPRADMVRNRERLIEAARAVFSAGGADASLEAVARHAEVGIATLYRHFPTREALFQAVYSREVDELAALAERLNESEPPLAALKTWMRAFVHAMATKKGMVTALAPALDPSATFFVDIAAKIRGAFEVLMTRAVAAGAVRDDVTPAEVLQAMLALGYSSLSAEGPDRVVRLLDVFVDGLARRPD